MGILNWAPITVEFYDCHDTVVKWENGDRALKLENLGFARFGKNFNLKWYAFYEVEGYMG